MSSQNITQDWIDRFEFEIKVLEDKEDRDIWDNVFLDAYKSQLVDLYEELERSKDATVD